MFGHLSGINRKHQIKYETLDSSVSKQGTIKILAYKRSSFTLAYFGFLWVSEYISCTSTKGRESLLLSDIMLVSDHILLTIRKDKTNQNGFPTCLKLMPTHKSCFPVQAYSNYCINRGNLEPHSACFVFRNGKCLSRQDVNFWLKTFLGTRFSSHSFRIGAATSACGAG